MSNRICVLGYFDYDGKYLDGQIVKTRNVHKLLQKYHPGEISSFNTMGVRRNPFLLFKLLWELIRCKTLVIIPAHNNLTYTLPVAYYLSKLFCYRIVLICIGGWQVEFFGGSDQFKPHPRQLKISKKIRAFLPEMKIVEEELICRFEFKNIEMFPNFRFFDTTVQQIENKSETLKLVFFARINKQKGYHTVFKFADQIIANNYNIIIDFYGPVNANDIDDFNALVDKYKSCVRYLGVLKEDEVNARLVNYDVVLLPTQYYTEGLPGTVLDAYIAGLPVIATEWKHSHEFIEDNKSGFIVPFDDCQKDFNDKILALYNDRQMLSKMKKQAFQKRLLYSSEYAWSILSKYL